MSKSQDVYLTSEQNIYYIGRNKGFEIKAFIIYKKVNSMIVYIYYIVSCKIYFRAIDN